MICIVKSFGPKLQIFAEIRKFFISIIFRLKPNYFEK